MSENRTSGYDRRRFLRDAAAGTAAISAGGLGAAALTAPAQAAPATAAPAAATGSRRSGAVSFRWWGTSGWRIDIGDRTVLVDPYLSRFSTGLFSGAVQPGDPAGGADRRHRPHLDRAENVLVTHTHWDHFNDVPYIAGRTGARVFGTLTAYHLGLAYGVPAEQLSPVKGGEVLDFGDYTVEVVGSLHSRNGGGRSPSRASGSPSRRSRRPSPTCPRATRSRTRSGSPAARRCSSWGRATSTSGT